MLHEDFPPNVLTYTCILKACGPLATTKNVKKILAKNARQGLLQDDIVLGISLLECITYS